MPPNPLSLANLHLDLLYETDQAGLILRSRDPDVAAPLLHLVRTTEGNRWLLAATLSHQQRLAIDEALASEPVIHDLARMETHAPVLDGIRELLANRHSPLHEHGGPAFLFPDLLPASTDSTELLMDPTNARTVPDLAWLRAVTPAQHPLAVARNPQGEVVAVCHSARSTTAAAEAGVETAPTYRGQGLATAVVLTWARAIKAQRRQPLYSTQWTNHPSRALARKLRLVMYAEDYHLR